MAENKLVNFSKSVFDALPDHFKCTISTPMFLEKDRKEIITQSGIFYKGLFGQSPEIHTYNFIGQRYNVYFKDEYELIQFAQISTELLKSLDTSPK